MVYLWATYNIRTKCITRGGADKSLALPTSRFRRKESIVSLERGACLCAELQVYSCYRCWNEACQAIRAISTTWKRELASSLFSERQGAEGNSRHSYRNIMEICTIVCHIQNWVTLVKRGKFFTCDAPRLRRPKTVTIRGLIEQIYVLILEHRRISAKSIAEQLDISRERVRPIIHEDLDMRKLSVKCVPKCLNADQKRQGCQLSGQIWIFGRDPTDFLSRLVTMDETWFITMTRRQSNNQWSGGIEAHPATKKNPIAKIR